MDCSKHPSQENGGPQNSLLRLGSLFDWAGGWYHDDSGTMVYQYGSGTGTGNCIDSGKNQEKSRLTPPCAYALDCHTLVTSSGRRRPCPTETPRPRRQREGEQMILYTILLFDIRSMFQRSPRGALPSNMQTLCFMDFFVYYMQNLLSDYQSSFSF